MEALKPGDTKSDALQSAAYKPRWSRFPSNWVVAKPGRESFFAKAIWFVLPVQYYVLNSFSGGLKDDYMALAMASLASIASLFAASCIFALIYYRASDSPQDVTLAHLTRFGGKYARGVRMWAIALIVTWAAVHIILAASYAVGGSRGDLIHVWLCPLFLEACNAVHPDFSLLTIFEYVLYAILATLLLWLARLAHRKLTKGGLSRAPAAGREPGIGWVILTVAALMTLINGVTTLPHGQRGICNPVEQSCDAQGTPER